MYFIVDVPVLSLPALQQRFNSGRLSVCEVRTVVEFLQDGRVRVLDVRPVQNAAHVPQHRHIILRQTRVGYTLRRQKGQKRTLSTDWNTVSFSFRLTSVDSLNPGFSIFLHQIIFNIIKRVLIEHILNFDRSHLYSGVLNSLYFI